MRVLISGGDGQVAGALLRTAPQTMEVYAPNKAEMDICVPDAVTRALAEFRPDTFINAAAYTHVDRAESEAEVAMRINADAVAQLADACAERDVQLVHLSTEYVFDGLSDEPYAVDAPQNPLSIYGLSKARGEDELTDAAALVRTSWVYDAGSANFVTAILGRLRDGRALRVVDDEFGCPSWAEGLADMLWRVVRQGAIGTFHHCDVGVISRLEFAEAIAVEARALRLIDEAPPIVPIPSASLSRPAKRPRRAVLDTGSTKDSLGYDARPWRENLKRMLRRCAAHA